MAVCVLLKHFSTYVYIGVLNTLVHWGVFLMLHHFLSVRQVVSNVCAFAVAATFSFYANSRYNFKRAASWARYLSFISFMAFLSFIIGWLGDGLAMPAVVTLIVFSGVSLVVGYFYSSYVVFRGRAT
ncbi:GtrA family protein [Pseudomonas sp. MWU13-2105]|uniref:GtrA family protein n=1 Tax=Pseudomonas sp. MWU13-2105 TaxID=2935074 RepID=UPI00200C1456|nr:GtrA family protein [Pseudomonas sp. MWU13-2105]